jgi:hypothetical protein
MDYGSGSGKDGYANQYQNFTYPEKRKTRTCNLDFVLNKFCFQVLHGTVQCAEVPVPPKVLYLDQQ